MQTRAVMPPVNAKITTRAESCARSNQIAAVYWQYRDDRLAEISKWLMHLGCFYACGRSSYRYVDVPHWMADIYVKRTAESKGTGFMGWWYQELRTVEVERTYNKLSLGVAAVIKLPIREEAGTGALHLRLNGVIVPFASSVPSRDIAEAVFGFVDNEGVAQ